MAAKALKSLVTLAAVLTLAGCLQPPDTGTASYGYGPHAPVHQAPFYQPPVYTPINQPPPLSPSLTPETAPIPAVGYTPPVRYLPPPAPPASLLTPSPTPPTSLLGPQRRGGN